MNNSKILSLIGSIILFLLGTYVLYNGYKYMKDHSNESLLKKYAQISIGSILCLISIAFIILTFTHAFSLIQNNDSCDKRINDAVQTEKNKLIPKQQTINTNEKFMIYTSDGMCVSDNGITYESKECDPKDPSLIYTMDEYSQIKNMNTEYCISGDSNDKTIVKPWLCLKENDQKYNIYGSSIINENGECLQQYPTGELHKTGCYINEHLSSNCAKKFKLIVI